MYSIDSLLDSRLLSSLAWFSFDAEFCYLTYQWFTKRLTLLCSPSGWIYDKSHSYPLAFLVSGGLCALASCILFLIPMFQETLKSEEYSSEKKATSEQRLKLPHQELCLQKITCFKLQVDSLQKDCTRFFAEAKESDVWFCCLNVSRNHI